MYKYDRHRHDYHHQQQHDHVLWVPLFLPFCLGFLVLSPLSLPLLSIIYLSPFFIKNTDIHACILSLRIIKCSLVWWYSCLLIGYSGKIYRYTYSHPHHYYTFNSLSSAQREKPSNLTWLSLFWISIRRNIQHTLNSPPASWTKNIWTEFRFSQRTWQGFAKGLNSILFPYFAGIFFPFILSLSLSASSFLLFHHFHCIFLVE